jgi:hypothetical protein
VGLFRGGACGTRTVTGGGFFEWQFLCGFSCFVLFVFQLTGCFVVISLVSAFSSDCVTDSQIKQSYM